MPVTVSKPRQDCQLVPREECDIMEMDETYQHCSVVPDPRETTEKKCSYKVKQDSYLKYVNCKIPGLKIETTNHLCFNIIC